MTLEQIEQRIKDCYQDLAGGGATEQYLKDLLHNLVPCLGWVGEVEDKCYVDWGVAQQDAIEMCELSGERWKMKWVEAKVAPQYAKYQRSKVLEQNLRAAISAVQTEMKITLI